MSFFYNFNYTKLYANALKTQKAVRQSITVNGDINITPSWKVTLQSGYDITARALTPTQLSLFRDLHCWQMSLQVVPFGTRKSFAFSLSAKASMLKDLRIPVRRDWYDLE